MRKKAVLYTSTIVIIIICIVGVFAYNTASRQTGERLLKDFYDFDLNTIMQNDEHVKEITTSEIYERFTLSSDNRQLRVYLKFAGDATTTNIISHKGNTIFYSIVNRNIDATRTFALQYHYSWGKIDKVVEYEVFFLPQSSRDDLND